MVLHHGANVASARTSGFESQPLRQPFGAMFELDMEPVLKTGGGNTLGGSNPSRSAILMEEFS